MKFTMKTINTHVTKKIYNKNEINKASNPKYNININAITWSIIEDIQPITKFKHKFDYRSYYWENLGRKSWKEIFYELDLSDIKTNKIIGWIFKTIIYPRWKLLFAQTERLLDITHCIICRYIYTQQRDKSKWTHEYWVCHNCKYNQYYVKGITINGFRT